MILFSMIVIFKITDKVFQFIYFKNDSTDTSHLRVVVLNGKTLAKKDIFGARYYKKNYSYTMLSLELKLTKFISDPYVRIDLNTINGDINIDSVLTKTKKKVSPSETYKVYM